MSAVALTILEEVQGMIPPDVNKVRLRGVEENYVGMRKTITITMDEEDSTREDHRYGGSWVARLTAPSGKMTTLTFTRTKNSEGEIEINLTEPGVWILYVEISGIPIANSPFTLKAVYPSSDTLSKYQIISSLFTGYHEASKTSIDGAVEVYLKVVNKASSIEDLEFHRNHLRRLIDASTGLGGEVTTEAIEVARSVIERGVIIEDPTVPIFEVKADALIVPHNSRMRWPSHGFQAALLERLDAKHRELVSARTTKFAENHPRALTYGSTIITSVVSANLRVSHLVNVVTVKLKKAKTTSDLSYEKVTYDDLKVALFTAFEEAQRNRHILSIILPNKISKEFGPVGKSTDTVKRIVTEWLSDRRNTNSIKTYYLAQRGDTPKPTRRRSRV